jgi:hypothetical protein
MAIRRLGPKTQLHYIRQVKRFADFLGQSADKATARMSIARRGKASLVLPL